MITIRIGPVVSIMFLVLVLAYSVTPIAFRGAYINGLYLTLADLVLLITALLFMPLLFKKVDMDKSSKLTFRLLIFIIIYSFISTFWSFYTGQYRYIFYQLVLALVTILIPYSMSKITNDKYVDYRKLLSNFSFLITLVLVFYAYQNGIDQRLSGPMGTAAILSVVIIPVMGVHLQNLLDGYRKVLSATGFFISVFGVFLTQSRSGLIVMFLFIAITLLRKPTIKRVFIMSISTILFMLLFFQNVSLDRMENMGFEDSARKIMFDTSLAWWHKTTGTFFFGNGYGSIWQWAKIQKEIIEYGYSPWTLTEQGYIMYHAHSIFNQLASETGLIGLIPFILVVFILFRETIKSWFIKNDLKTTILISLICTLPIFITDLLIFRNWNVSIIWLFFFFSALAYKTERNPDKQPKQTVL